MISLTVILSLWSPSPAVQAASGIEPSATFTMMMISFTVTTPVPSQSPVQGTIVAVADAVDVGVAVDGGLSVGV